MHYITRMQHRYLGFISVQPLLEPGGIRRSVWGEGLRALRDTAGREEEEGGHEVKNARSLVVASNWNTILTPKPKIGEYSSLAPFPSSPSPSSNFFRQSFSLPGGGRK